jgi:hypothetical protein
MKKECPYCGARFDQATLSQLRMFEGSFVTGGRATCVGCGRTISLNEIAGIHHTDLSDYVVKKKWWQFWKK